MGITAALRHELATRARSRRTRTNEFHPDRPNDWRPRTVRNADGLLEDYFTDESAWNLIAEKLDEGHPVTTVKLETPRGSTGYVMVIDLESGVRLYIKLQLSRDRVIGRSFHESEPT